MSAVNSVWKFYGDISPNDHFIIVQNRFFKGHFLKISFSSDSEQKISPSAAFHISGNVRKSVHI